MSLPSCSGAQFIFVSWSKRNVFAVICLNSFLSVWDLKKSLLAILILAKIIIQKTVNREVSSMEYGFESGMIKIAAKIAIVIANVTIKRMLRREKKGERVFMVFLLIKSLVRDKARCKSYSKHRNNVYQINIFLIDFVERGIVCRFFIKFADKLNFRRNGKSRNSCEIYRRIFEG